ncbi:MAG: VOC family protein [Tissierellales bacterium]
MSKYHDKPNIYVTQMVLKVKDLKRSVEFYKDIMGLQVLEEKDREVKLTVDGITPMVTLTQPKDLIDKLPRRTGLYHFAVLLPSRFHLGLFLKNIRDKQYPIVGGSNHGVSEAVYLEDPDKNGIEVYADTPEDTWDRKDDEINMVTEALDYLRIIEATGDKKWEGAPSETIIGHIHLHVGDLDDSLNFYEALGFNLVQAMKNQAYFISTGGYHHHIGFNIWNGRGAVPPPDNSIGMKYYTLKYPSKEKLQAVLNRLKSLGYKYTEDENKIFIFDPSLNLIQIVL